MRDSDVAVSFPAKAGDRAVRMACSCQGQTTIVHERFVDGWRCGKCRRPGRPTGHVVVLGEMGWELVQGDGVYDLRFLGSALPATARFDDGGMVVELVQTWRDPPLCPEHLLSPCVICEAVQEADG